MPIRAIRRDRRVSTGDRPASDSSVRGVLANPSLTVLLAFFAGAAGAIGIAGTRPAHAADALPDRTGVGEILAGAVLVGASTSLPGALLALSAVVLPA